jgi:hypothetical protein
MSRGVGRLALPATIWHKMLMRELRRREFSVIKMHAVRWILFLLMFTVCGRGSFAADPGQSLSLDAYLKRLGYQNVKMKDNALYRPLVEAKLSNGKNVVCLVTTGETISTIAEGSAKGLKTLGQLGVEVEDHVLGRLTNSDICLVEKLVVGPAEFYNHPARIVKQKTPYTTMPNTATLGCDFLLRHYCLLDFGGRFLCFRANRPSVDETEALSASLRNTGFQEIAIHEALPWSLDAQINRTPVTLALHTGAGISVLEEARVRSFGLPTIKRESASFIPRDASGLLLSERGDVNQLRMVTVSDFGVADTHWSNVHFGLANTSLAGYKDANGTLHGVLGPDFLTSHQAVWDFASGKLWLLRNEKKRP